MLSQYISKFITRPDPSRQISSVDRALKPNFWNLISKLYQEMANNPAGLDRRAPENGKRPGEIVPPAAPPCPFQNQAIARPTSLPRAVSNWLSAAAMVFSFSVLTGPGLVKRPAI